MIYIDQKTFVTIECPRCGVLFGMTERRNDLLRETGESFYCISGHTQSYHETTVQKMEKKLRVAEDNKIFWKDQAHAEERSNIALRGVVTRKKNQLKRVSNGVCPCCNRHFKNLERHMKGKHLKYLEEE